MSSVVSKDRLNHLLDSVLELLHLMEIDETVEHAVAAARHLTDSSYSAIGIVDTADPHRLSNLITDGLTPKQIARIDTFTTGNELLDEVIKTGKPLVIDDLSSDPRAVEFLKGRPAMNRLLGAPIRLASGNFGAIYVCDRIDGAPYDRSDVEVIEALASAVAAKIQNIELRERLTNKSVTTDRIRIAQDLHDDIIQRLFAVGLQLQSTLRRIADANAVALINQSIEDLDLTIGQIRTTIFDLEITNTETTRGHVLDLTREIANAGRIHSEIRFEGPVDTVVVGQLRTVVLAATRELVTNVVRHARAKQIALTLSVVGNIVTLRVVDDGIGLMPGAGGLGIRNLRSRAQTLNGDLTIVARAIGGTVATVTLPFDLTEPEPYKLDEPR
ncbi:MAG: GAF domain-containing sensor histidine kinase [Ferrimicrobium sp.]